MQVSQWKPVQRDVAIDQRRWPGSTVKAARRGTAAAIAAALLAVQALGGSPAGAVENRDPRDPDARLQVVIHAVKVLDDNDWGEGEFKFELKFWREVPDCDRSVGPDECRTVLASSAPIEFSADDGDLVAINRTLPDAYKGAKTANDQIGPDIGIPVWSGETYGMELNGWEVDPVVDEDVQRLRWELSAANGWDLGRRTERGRQSINRTHLLPQGFGFEPADTVVDYEIRKMPLPDLRINTLRVLPGGASDQLCAATQNIGSREASTYRVTFTVNGTVLPGGVAAPPSGLAPDQTGGVCIDTKLPAGGRNVVAYIDAERLIAEENEHNNRMEAPYPAQLLASPTPAQADLTVESIAVKDAKGQTDCDPGKNDVTVTVRNGGGAAAGAFAVRLAVDADDGVKERLVPGLAAGKTTEVVIAGVQLKKGEHTLQATVDAKSTVPEATENNNKKSISVSCSVE